MCRFHCTLCLWLQVDPKLKQTRWSIYIRAWYSSVVCTFLHSLSISLFSAFFSSLALCFMARLNPLSLLYCIVFALCFAFYLFDLFFISHTCSRKAYYRFSSSSFIVLVSLQFCYLSTLYYYYAVSFLTTFILFTWNIWIYSSCSR